MTEEKRFIDNAQEVAKDVAEKAKDVAIAAKEKVSSFVGDHEDQIYSGIDKTGGFVDEKTKGRFSEKIHKAQEAAKGAVTKISGADGEGTDGGSTEPATGTGEASGTTSPTSSKGPEED